MWARSPSSWCRCRSSGRYSSCSKRKTLRPAQRLEGETRKNCSEKRRVRDKPRWKLRNEMYMFYLFYRCSRYHFPKFVESFFEWAFQSLIVAALYMQKWNEINVFLVLYEWCWFFAWRFQCSPPARKITNYDHNVIACHSYTVKAFIEIAS